jgi:uncharacterized protein (DUF2236 family)
MKRLGVRAAIALRFRRIITSTADGVPPWLPDVAAGDDVGLFGPTDAPWRVHADLTTLIGGIRALLVQALHPGSLAGVMDHSRYEADPLGRLAGTTRWLTILTFGSQSAIAKESHRVNAMHGRVTGDYHDAHGRQSTYQARDPRLLLWVHIAFTESFLTAFQEYSGRQVDANQYVAQWARAVEPLGLSTAPRSWQDLQEAISGFDEELSSSTATQRVVSFIRRPPLSRTARAAYWFLFQAAVATIPSQYRQMLGVTALPMKVVHPVTRLVISAMRWAIGPQSPIEEAALARRSRLGAA